MGISNSDIFHQQCGNLAPKDSLLIYLPSSLMKRSGLNWSGSTKCFGSFMMKEMLAMKLEPGGKVYDMLEEVSVDLEELEAFDRLMEVVAVEVWGIEEGATLAIL